MGIIETLLASPDYIRPRQTIKHYRDVISKLKIALSTSVVSSCEDTTEFCLNLTTLSNRYFQAFVTPDEDENYKNTVRNVLVLLINAWTNSFIKLQYHPCLSEVFEPLYDKAILRGIRQNEINLFWRKLYYLYQIVIDDYPELEMKFDSNFHQLPERQLERLFHLLTFITELKLKYDSSVIPNYVIARLYQVKQIMIKRYITNEDEVSYYPYSVEVGNDLVGRYRLKYGLFKFKRCFTKEVEDSTKPVFLGDYTMKDPQSSLKPKKAVKVVVKRSRKIKEIMNE